MVRKIKDPILSIQNLSVWFSENQAIKDVSIDFPKNKIISIMGPSGCGKSTLLRAINRMHDLDENARVKGNIHFENKEIMEMDAMKVRQKIGMVFQRPNPFPNMTIFENVIAGYTLTNHKLSKSEKKELVEENLKKAMLFDEVKDRLHSRGTFLSGGQQQRLCIARSLAMKVDILLLDEPTSALDPIATTHIENLIEKLSKDLTIIIVTHSNSQASRISHFTGFMYLGNMIEYNKTKTMFTVPKNKKTEEYLTGVFG